MSEASWGLVMRNEEGGWPLTGVIYQGARPTPRSSACLLSPSGHLCRRAAYLAGILNLLAGQCPTASQQLQETIKESHSCVDTSWDPQPENHRDSLWGRSCWAKWSSNHSPAQSCWGTPGSWARYSVAVPAELWIGGLCVFTPMATAQMTRV